MRAQAQMGAHQRIGIHVHLRAKAIEPGLHFPPPIQLDEGAHDRAGDDQLAIIVAVLARVALDPEPILHGLGRLAPLACPELALAPSRQPTGPIEPLTARELAVLRMLPLRMSNREMAAQLYISLNTVKTHVRAIYRKLDVPNRSAAVHRATALQLV